MRGLSVDIVRLLFHCGCIQDTLFGRFRIAQAVGDVFILSFVSGVIVCSRLCLELKIAGKYRDN